MGDKCCKYIRKCTEPDGHMCDIFYLNPNKLQIGTIIKDIKHGQVTQVTGYGCVSSNDFYIMLHVYSVVMMELGTYIMLMVLH